MPENFTVCPYCGYSGETDSVHVEAERVSGERVRAERVKGGQTGGYKKTNGGSFSQGRSRLGQAGGRISNFLRSLTRSSKRLSAACFLLAAFSVLFDSPFRLSLLIFSVAFAGIGVLIFTGRERYLFGPFSLLMSLETYSSRYFLFSIFCAFSFPDFLTSICGTLRYGSYILLTLMTLPLLFSLFRPRFLKKIWWVPAAAFATVFLLNLCMGNFGFSAIVTNLALSAGSYFIAKWLYEE